MRDCIVYLAHLVKIESGIFDAYIDFRLDRDFIILFLPIPKIKILVKQRLILNFGH